MNPSIAARAEQLRLSNRVGEAVALLQAASDDADALYQHGVWLLAGVGGVRDIGKARQRLRKAAMRGHIKAMHFEVALTANGSGGQRDWVSALAQLRQCALVDPSGAGGDLQLLDAMDLDRDGAPRSLPAPELLHADPMILRYRGLVGMAEAQAIIATVADIIRPSVVVDSVTGQSCEHPIRSSESAVIGPTRESLVVSAINKRLAAASKTVADQGEPLSILRYRGGQQYRLHHDCIAGARNQRTKTALVYLNDGYTGGETAFPDIGLRVRGGAGDVVIFDNCDEQGRPDLRMRHAGLPVTKGVKWLATRWIRMSSFDPWTAG